MIHNNNRIYYCVNCNKRVEHCPESETIGIYYCKDCGEFKTNNKFKTIFKNK